MKRKFLLPSIIVLVLTIVVFSGCTDLLLFEVSTLPAGIRDNGVILGGLISPVYFERDDIYNMTFHIVLDTESHEDFQDYAEFLTVENLLYMYRYTTKVRDLDENIIYRYRAVIYYVTEDTWYQGKEVSFIL